MPQTIQVVGAVAMRDHEVLACRRRPEKSAGGRWEFPGGKVEPGESAPVALAREIAEELSVQCYVGTLLDRSTTVVEDTAIDLACYLVKFASPPVESSDHDVLTWVPISQITDLDWADPDWPAVRVLASGRHS